MMDGLGIHVQRGVSSHHVPVNCVPAGQVAETGLLIGTSGGKGDLHQCLPETGQAGTQARLDGAHHLGPPSGGLMRPEFGGRGLVGDRVFGRWSGKDLFEFPDCLANMAGEGNQPGGTALPKPFHQLVDHCREATQLLQIPGSMPSGHQRLKVKRRNQ